MTLPRLPGPPQRVCVPSSRLSCSHLANTARRPGLLLRAVPRMTRRALRPLPSPGPSPLAVLKAPSAPGSNGSFPGRTSLTSLLKLWCPCPTCLSPQHSFSPHRSVQFTCWVLTALLTQGWVCPFQSLLRSQCPAESRAHSRCSVNACGIGR